MAPMVLQTQQAVWLMAAPWQLCERQGFLLMLFWQKMTLIML